MPECHRGVLLLLDRFCNVRHLLKLLVVQSRRLKRNLVSIPLNVKGASWSCRIPRITRISAVMKIASEASRSQSSIPIAALVILFDVKRRPTAVTESAVKTTPVPTIAAPWVLRPRTCSISLLKVRNPKEWRIQMCKEHQSCPRVDYCSVSYLRCCRLTA